MGEGTETTETAAAHWLVTQTTKAKRDLSQATLCLHV